MRFSDTEAEGVAPSEKLQPEGRALVKQVSEYFDAPCALERTETQYFDADVRPSIDAHPPERPAAGTARG